MSPSERPSHEGGAPQGLPASQDRAQTGRPARWGLVALIGLVAAAYGQTLWFGFVSDDHHLLAGTPVVRGLQTVRNAFASPQSAYLPHVQGAERMYRPLLAISVALDRAGWGMRPGGFHLSSVLAHLVTVLLLYALARRVTGRTAVSFGAAALLAVHPSAVEAVAWVAARMDVFVGLGLTAALTLGAGCATPGGGLRLAGALVCFAFALGSKETAMAFPALVTWAAWVSPQGFAASEGSSTRAALAARVAPFWLVLGLYAMVRHAVVGNLTSVPVRLADIPAQVPRALVAIATYAEMTLIPRPVTGHITVAEPSGPGDGRVLLGLGIVALLLGGLLCLRRRHSASAFALGWYAVALVPAANLLPIYSKQGIYVAEHVLYPALVGWCLLVAVGAHALWALLPSPAKRSRLLPAAVAGAVLGTLLVVTAVKVAAWRDDVSLWTAALVSDPDSALIRGKLGTALAVAGDLQGAQAVVQEARARFPADPRFLYLDGLIAQLGGHDREAYRDYKAAIALGAREDVILRQAAVLAARFREWDRAGHWFAEAAVRFPREAWPQVGLGWYSERHNRSDLARAHFDRAARLEPSAPERPWFLGQLRAAEGRTAEAADAYRTALTLDPSYGPARRQLAVIAEQEGRTAEAIGHWRRIAESLPESHRGEASSHLRRLESGAAIRAPAELR